LPEKNRHLYSEYAGVYQWKPGLEHTVLVKEGKPDVAITGSPPAPNFRVSDSEYMSKNDWGKITFHREADVKVSHDTYMTPDGQRVPKVK
jgi:hypothetical protein